MKAPEYGLISRLLVEKGVREALKALLGPGSQAPGAIRDRAHLLLGRYNALERQQLAGTISQQDYQLELNRIQLSLMNLLSQADSKKSHYRLLYRLVFAVIALTVAGSGAWLLSRPVWDMEVTFADVQASRVTLRSGKTAALFLGQKVDGLSLYNFSEVVLEADAISPEKASNGGSGNADLRITPLPGIGSVGLHLGAVSLESLHFEDSAIVVITQVEGAPERFRIQVQQSMPFNGRLNYAGPLAVSSTYVAVEKNGQGQEYYEPFEWQAHALPGFAREITFSGNPADFIFEFSLRDSIVEKELLVRGLEFFQPEQQQVKSSILGGAVLLQEADQPPLRSLPLKEGSRIDLEPAGRLLVHRLCLQSSGIFLEATGKLQALYTYEGGERRLRNPTLVGWLWHNQGPALLGGGMLLLALLALLTPWLSGRIIDGLNHFSFVNKSESHE